MVEDAAEAGALGGHGGRALLAEAGSVSGAAATNNDHIALAAGLVTALVVLVFVPRSYEASATLVVVPPKFSSELRPATLTVQGY